MNNLQSFFRQEQSRAKQLHHLLDGKITLFIRPKSAYWQARFQLPNKEYIRLSTGHYDLDEAKTQAVILYETIKTKIKMGTPIRVRTFGDVARIVLRELRASRNTNKHKRTYRDYVFVIQKYLVPFFGKKLIAELTADDIREFEEWRVSVMGKIPKASTHLRSRFTKFYKASVYAIDACKASIQDRNAELAVQSLITASDQHKSKAAAFEIMRKAFRIQIEAS